MIKKALSQLVRLLPPSLQREIRHVYWRIKSTILYKQLYQILRLEYTLESGVTLRVKSKGEWWTYNDIFVNREYDVPIQKALQSRSLERPFTVLDLGANVGYFYLRVVDLMRQSDPEAFASDVTLVEGSPTTYKELKGRLAPLTLSNVNLRLVHGLVGQRAGKGVIQESAVHVKNTIMETGKHGGASVDFVNLDQVMENRPQIDLLKCDIEGAELQFIENYGDLLHRVKNAVFEFHHEQCDTARCVTLLEQLGFSQQGLRSNAEVSICFFFRA